MTIENIRKIALLLKGTTEEIKWENHLCFTIGTKMYLVTNPDDYPVTASIKVSDDNFESLTSQEGIIPAPYMARHKWVHLDDINRWSTNEWEELIKQAYQLIFSKLGSKVQKEILK